MSSDLEKLARRYGIASSYEGPDRKRHRAPRETLRRMLAAFGVAAETEAVRAESLSVAPEPPRWRLRAPVGDSCYLPDSVARERCWGIAIQLYALRSSRNWGIGDFTDLANFARMAAARGADFVGLNPLHALFLSNPFHCSPFSPSNRRFLNPLYIAVDAVAGFTALEMPSNQMSMLHRARDAELVDYATVAHLKTTALRAIWRLGLHDRAAVAEFATAGGEPLRRHALFEAISARMTAEGRGAGWHDWDEEWRHPDSAAVASFASSNSDELDFFVWIQWVAAEQLAGARDATRAAGMRIGLYLDFAVGEASDGSSTWSNPEITLRHVHIGAPPDYFNAAGQDWSLAPLSPASVAANGAGAFRSLVRAASKCAGALRIDHAMSLWQLFLIPDGCTAAEGTYVRFPIGDMIRALASASHSSRTIMIGEDLGNVPRGFRSVMSRSNILSYRLLFFERDDSGYIPPADYPRKALICLSTHDLPTLEGWWRGDDVELRSRFSLIDAAAATEQKAARAVERRQLLDILVDGGLLTAVQPHAAADAGPALDVVVALHQHLARAPSLLLAARLEDLVGQREPVNVPGTTDEYPKWQRKIPVPVEELNAQPLFRDVTAALRRERPRGLR